MEPKLIQNILTEEDYDWIREAYTYGAATTLRAASQKLSLFREYIITGAILSVRPESESKVVDNTIMFDEWVLKHFPDLIETQLYPSS